MRKVLFTVAAAIMLLVGNATVFADGTNPQQTTSGYPPSGPSTTATTTPPSQTYQARIDIQNHAFSPANLTIWQGTSVIWTNRDNTAHTVTSTNASSGQGFDSGLIQPGQHFGWLFGGTGTFTYHCSIHPDMTGTITVVVKPAPAPMPNPPAPNIPNPPAPSANAQSNATATVNNYNTFNQGQEKEPAPAATTVSPPATNYSTPGINYSKGTPTTTVLPNTGPASAIALAAGAAILGTGASYLYLFMRRKLLPKQL